MQNPMSAEPDAGKDDKIGEEEFQSEGHLLLNAFNTNKCRSFTNSSVISAIYLP